MLWPDFRRYADFSPETPNSTALLSLLNTGYLTRNGDYAPFAMISESLSGVFGVLNTIPGVSVPRKPEQLAARVAFLRTLSMESVRRVGSHNPLNFLNCHTPSTGTIFPLFENPLTLLFGTLSAFTRRVLQMHRKVLDLFGCTLLAFAKRHEQNQSPTRKTANLPLNYSPFCNVLKYLSPKQRILDSRQVSPTT
jgi:hypothetical protein